MGPKDGYIKYIVNPKSGATSSKLLVSGFREYLVDKGYDVRQVTTKSLTHARELASEEAVKYDCALVVIAGGDGTVREAAHGLEGSDKPLLMLPCGTENLLASELGFDEKVETVIRAFESWNIRKLDLGKAAGRCFTSIAGIGFDGDVVHRVSAMRSGHIHHLDYFWPIWRTFWDYKFPFMKIEVDGQVMFEGRGMAFVGNISRYAIGLEILSRANYSDGLLDVCAYRCSHQYELIKHSVMTAVKKHTHTDSVFYKQGKHIKITSDVDVATEIDGDPGPNLPIDISVIEEAVKVIVPPGAKPAGMRTRLMRMLG